MGTLCRKDAESTIKFGHNLSGSVLIAGFENTTIAAGLEDKG